MQSENSAEKSPEQPAAAKGKHKGAVQVRADRVIALREAKGWSPRTLAIKAGCSPVTIKSLEEGKDALPSTLEKIAGPLGMPYTYFMAQVADVPAVLPTAAGPSSPANVKVVLSVRYKGFDETKVFESITSIRQEISPTGEFLILLVTDGSVAIHMQMQVSDALQLCFAFFEGRMETSKVLSIGLYFAGIEALKAVLFEHAIHSRGKPVFLIDEFGYYIFSYSIKYRKSIFGLVLTRLLPKLIGHRASAIIVDYCDNFRMDNLMLVIALHWTAITPLTLPLYILKYRSGVRIFNWPFLLYIISLILSNITTFYSALKRRNSGLTKLTFGIILTNLIAFFIISMIVYFKR